MKKIIDLAKTFIQIPSVADNKNAQAEIIKLCGEILKPYPFKKFEKNENKSRIYSNTKKIPKKFSLILNAHLDVVPGKPEQFRPFIKDDKLFGRGAQDMKAASAILVLLFSKLAKDLTYPIGLQLVLDEEIGGFDGTNFQIEKGVTSDFVIAGESTDMYINNEAKGVLWVEFEIKGKSSHSAYIWNGENAIVATASLINLLLKEFPIPKIEKWQTTCNIAKIETTNDAVNKVPEKCRLVVDIRYIPSDLSRLKKIIESCKSSSISVRYLEEGSASFTKRSEKGIKLLRKTLKEFNLESGFVKKHGSSDIRFYNESGINGVTFGPTGSGLHGDKEWVTLKSLEQYYKVMESYLRNYSK